MQTLSCSEARARLDAGTSLLLDVRNADEVAFAHLEGAHCIPLPELPDRIQELDPDRPVIVLCHHGVRSEMAGRFLEQTGFKNFSHVRGGIDAWSRDIDADIPRY